MSETPICICHVCTCGKHHCPIPHHNNVHYNADDLQTSHQRDYVPHRLEGRRETPRRGYAPNPVKFDGTSTHQSDFPRYDASEYNCPAHKVAAPAREKVPFTATTSNQDDFVPHPLERRAPTSRREYQPNPVKFDGTSTQHADFPRYDPNDYARPRERTADTAREKVPFTGTTSHQDDFIRHPLERREEARKREYQPNPVKFDGTSTQHADFPRYDPHDYARPTERTSSTPREKVPFIGTTSHQDDFIQHPLERRESARKREYAPNPVKFDGTSTQHADFPRYDPNDYARPQERAPTTARENVPFTGTTSHQDDFVPHPLERREAARRREYAPNPVKFDGTSTQHADFPRYDPNDYARPQERSATTQREKVPFVGTTSHQDDFIPHPLEPRESSARKREYAPNPVKFDGTSTQHADFPRYDPNDYARPQERAPATARENVPFTGTTSHQDDFVPHPLERRESARRREYAPNPVKFDGTSTQHADFPRYDPNDYARPRERAAETHREAVPFTGTTSHQDDFVPHPLERRESARKREYAPNPVKFDGTSTQHADFPRYDPNDYARPQERAATTQREKVPFVGTTSHQDDFVPHPLEARESARKREYAPNPVKFEGSTTARDDFQPHEIAVCPAATLPPRAPAADEHVYFTPTEVRRYSPKRTRPTGLAY